MCGRNPVRVVLPCIPLRFLTRLDSSVGTVAQGALSFALNPFRETSVAGEDVGLTFLMDRSASGVEWRGDRVEEAIGWVITKVRCPRDAFTDPGEMLIAHRANRPVTGVVSN